MMFCFRSIFTDLDYLDWFSRYERFCEPRYIFTNISSNSPAVSILQIYLKGAMSRAKVYCGNKLFTSVFLSLGD